MQHHFLGTLYETYIERSLCSHCGFRYRFNAEKGPVSLADISERQHISLSYLEQLFAKLRRDGLVKSVRGPGGGYQLGLPSDQFQWE